MTDTTPQHTSTTQRAGQPDSNPFPTIPATQLRVGDLIQRGSHGDVAHELVARAAMIDGRVQLMVYDRDHPHSSPVEYRPGDLVMLACRDLIEPDDGLRAWTDASWRRAYRRGAAFALMDQIRARSVELPPITGADEEINRLRGRDSLPPVIVSVSELHDLLAAQHLDGRLALHVDQPAVRAILALFIELKDVESADGSWSGADTVAIVCDWFTRLGIDPTGPADQLGGRMFTTDRVHSGPRLSQAENTDRETATADPQHGTDDEHDRQDGFVEVDRDRIADLVRAVGVECTIDTPGGGVAVLLAGPPTAEPNWAFPWAAQAGPGRFGWDEPSIASTRDLCVGPDTADRARAIPVHAVGAVTEAQIAALVLAQVRIADPDLPLTHAELAAAGLHAAADHRRW